MRVYLQPEQLGEALAKGLAQKGKTQSTAAKELNITQGQISHFLSGHFKTKKGLVIKVCKYVNIDPDNFIETSAQTGDVGREAIDALARACGGQKQKTQAVIRVLRALETLTPTS